MPYPARVAEIHATQDLLPMKQKWILAQKLGIAISIILGRLRVIPIEKVPQGPTTYPARIELSDDFVETAQDLLETQAKADLLIPEFKQLTSARE
ncbi:hypothetical protein ACFL2D_02485 [Patescibacteria group bacterium]